MLGINNLFPIVTTVSTELNSQGSDAVDLAEANRVERQRMIEVCSVELAPLTDFIC
jgi:hypothetical protein